MNILITGADGFIGKNLTVHLAENKDINIYTFTREHSYTDLIEIVHKVDFIFHLAGVNRTENIDDFKSTNIELNKAICNAIMLTGRKIPVIYSSSIQATLDNPYGVSKREGEAVLQSFAEKHQSPVYIYRLPNVFGKWAKPNYNSAVATFCYNIARGLPIHINDPQAAINLVYIDDVITHFIMILMDKNFPIIKHTLFEVKPIYSISVGELATTIKSFYDSRSSLIMEPVGTGLIRALYATYVSYLPTGKFSYEVAPHEDARGIFVEFLKTKDSGQFSFFTAHPGIIRGGHYHHSKTEKFMVIKGSARFRFKHMVTDEYYELFTSDKKYEIVETAPGWTHDIMNTGNEEMIVLLWANEIFSRNLPDTFAGEL